MNVLLSTDDGPQRHVDVLPPLLPGVAVVPCATEDEAVVEAAQARVLVHRERKTVPDSN